MGANSRCWLLPPEHHILSHWKGVLHYPCGGYSNPQHIINSWKVIRSTDTIKSIKIATGGREGGKEGDGGREGQEAMEEGREEKR